jgi:putative spermidine/putrescine transport system permease protein
LRKYSSSYPFRWRLLDALEHIAVTLWPARLQRFTPYLYLMPAFLLVFVLVLGLIYIGDYSLHELDTVTFLLKEQYSFGNYQQISGRPVYLHIIWRSLFAAVIVTLITLILAFPYAYLMVRTASSWLRRILLISLFLPFFIGQVVRAYGWLIILGQQGIVNSSLEWLGFEPVRIIFTYPAVLLGLIQYMLPFAVLLLAPALTAIDEDLELASESLGAPWWRTFQHVVLPLAKPGLVAAAVVVFTLTLTDYAMPEILGGGTLDFIANAVYDGFFQISDAGLGSALAIVLVLMGSALVAVIFTLLGVGTLSLMGNRQS